MRRTHMRRTAALALSTMLALAACGASEATVDSVPDTSPTTNERTTTEEPATTEIAEVDPLDVEFSSEPIDVGPILGSSGTADTDAEVSCVAGSESTCDDQVASCTSDSDEPCTDFIDDEPPLPDDEPPSFEPAAADEPFCSLLADLDSRPFPSDDAEAVTVIRVWIGALRDVAVEPLRNDLDLLIQALDDAIAGGVGFAELESDTELDDANDRLETYVDSACEGVGTPVPDDEPTTTFDDPPLPGGLVIPVIDFSDTSETGRRIFGERDESRFDDGFVPAEADQGICTALDIVAGRPTPTEDLDEIRFVDGYVQAIRPLAPDEIADELDLVLEWTHRIVAAGEFTEEAEDQAEDAIGPAVETIDTFVDSRCNGI